MIIPHKKNTAYYLVVPMVDSTTPASFKTGLSPTDTAYYKDGAGAWTSLAITDTLTEIGATGLYALSLTASEMNHDWVIIKITASGAADTFVMFRMSAAHIDDLVRASDAQQRAATAQAGTAGTITLDAGASAVDDYYKHARCFLTGGTGAGQCQIIDSYVGSTKVATMAANWPTTPDNTTTFVLLPLGSIPGATAPTAGQVADAVWDEPRADHEAAGSVGEALEMVLADAVNKKRANKSTGETQVFKADGTTELFARTVQNGPTAEEVDLVPS
jgi:hypothetical protein